MCISITAATVSQDGGLAPKQLTQLSLKRLVGKKENAPASVPEPLSLPQHGTPPEWDEKIFVLLASAMVSSLITAGLKLRGNNTRQEEHFYMWPVLFMGFAMCQQCMQPGGLLLIWRTVHFFSDSVLWIRLVIFLKLLLCALLYLHSAAVRGAIDALGKH